MNYPLLSDYIEAIKAAEDNFEQLKHLRPVLDEEGNPVMTGGNFAEVFKMKDDQTGKFYAVKCFLREQEGRAEAYRQIAEELEYVSSTFLTPIRYLDKELFVDTNASDDTEFPVLLMDWVEGETLDKYIRKHLYDQYELSLLAYQFSRLAMWLMPQPFAHGDLKPDNILVKSDGTLVLVDYDGMYVPAMKGQRARELGSPDFRHPSRTVSDFDEHIDDFSLASILLSLKAISLQPSLLEEYGASDRLLFSEKDYRNLSESKVMDALKPLMQDAELASLYSLFILAASQNNLSQVSFRLFNLSKPERPQYEEENLSTEVTEEDWANAWKDEYGVMYSKDRKRLLGVYGCYLPDYEIPEGTKVICDDALNGFWNEIEGLMISGKITIPSTVQHIGRNPFRGDYDSIICNSPYFVVEGEALYSVDKKRLIACFHKGFDFVVPDSVEEIGSFAFYDCSIYCIKIPKSVSHIGDNPFVDAGINNVIIDSDSCYYYVEDGALYRRKPQELVAYWGKTNLLFVDEKTTKIGPFAFWNGIEKIGLPDSIRKISESAFYGYDAKPKQIYIPENSPIRFENLIKNEYGGEILRYIHDDYGVAYSNDKQHLLRAPKNIVDYEIKKGTIYIEDSAFSWCRNLRNIEIPSSVVQLGSQCFWCCRSLTHVDIPDSVEIIGSETFVGCESLLKIYIPASVKEIPERLFESCESLKTVRMLAPLGKIGDYAFLDCYSLEEIIIPESVTDIGTGAFANCSSIKEIVLPDLIVNIDDSVFSGCSSLIYINIPNSVQKIGKEAFSACKALSNILLPKSLITIGERAFYSCNNLISIILLEDIKSIERSAFENCKSLRSIIIRTPKDSNKHMQVSLDAFAGCESVEYFEWSEADIATLYTYLSDSVSIKKIVGKNEDIDAEKVLYEDEMKFKAMSLFYNSIGMNITKIRGNNKDNKSFKNIDKNWPHSLEEFNKSQQSKSFILSQNWYRSSGIGVVLGWNKYRAIDVDNVGYHYKEDINSVIADFLSHMGLPNDYPWVVRSGSGSGFHIIFISEILENEQSAKAYTPNFQYAYYGSNLVYFERLELRCKDHLILPPSIHFSGKRYEFWHGIPDSEPTNLQLYNIDNLIFHYCGRINIQNYNFKGKTIYLVETCKYYTSYDDYGCFDHGKVSDTIEWQEKSNTPEANNSVGIRYVLGNSVNVNKEKALHYFMLSDSDVSNYNIASLIACGYFEGSRKDVENYLSRIKNDHTFSLVNYDTYDDSIPAKLYKQVRQNYADLPNE